MLTPEEEIQRTDDPESFWAEWFARPENEKKQRRKEHGWSNLHRDTEYMTEHMATLPPDIMWRNSE